MSESTVHLPLLDRAELERALADIDERIACADEIALNLIKTSAFKAIIKLEHPPEWFVAFKCSLGENVDEQTLRDALYEKLIANTENRELMAESIRTVAERFVSALRARRHWLCKMASQGESSCPAPQPNP
jgi:hypothetical protein